MKDDSAAYQALGRAVVEEVLLGAGLSQAKDPSADSIEVALTFHIAADAAANCLVIRCTRIGNPPLEIHLSI